MPTELLPKTLFSRLWQAEGAILVLRPAASAPKPAPRQPGLASEYRQPYDDIFIAMLAQEQRVLAFNGHVDLGTGVRTALAQIVAEELYLPLDAVQMLLGHTSATPNQGPTIASATIQISSMPLRQAAAVARQFLLDKAAAAWGLAADTLLIEEGGRICAPDGRSTLYWPLFQAEHHRLPHSDQVQLKPAASYTLVGKPASRVDIPAKATGQLVYVHDVRVPGMWHARVVRPPYVGRDAGPFVGKSLISVDKTSVAHIAPEIEVVVLGDFVAVAAPREEQAIAAAQVLKVEWQAPPPLIDLQDLDAAVRSQPYTERVLREQTEAPPEVQAGVQLHRTYIWPYQMHASIGPSCSVADYGEDGVRVWSGTQNPHMLRIELSRLLQEDEGRIDIVRMEAAGCYGRNCADDVCADAALVSRAIGRPVRVQLTREQEHGWEPKGATQLMDVQGGLDDQGGLLSYDFTTCYPSNDAPTLALLLTGVTSAEPRMLEMGDRTAVPPYRYPNMHIVCHDMAAIVRSAWLRGVSALPNSFAHESFIDELAFEAGKDPVDFRLANLDDARARDVLQATARHAEWVPGTRGSRGEPDAQGWMHGRGVSYARYIHSRFPGFGAAWAAWVVDLSVHAQTGQVKVQKIVVGQDTGMVVNPDGVRHQIHGNVIQMLGRTLKERVSFDEQGVTALEWGAYPLATFVDIPPIEVLQIPRQDEPPMGSGESASVPAPAAIANALFDATGRRFYEAPFTPDVVLMALRQATWRPASTAVAH
ncbi:xanthine dehydrogenase family protein molybdopterin-binding subunit [Pusillimonas sp. CC-YST705]|uniref:Xanthine dehydrogenase family protein molybdopterin-binding subunit n=1 Tax=Mesopusillimonas faecipullorum TaxID=2755040 RepID=A0ABS8CEI2_9BURK|nr:molybdopterin cofactor-binding domain-containing protein [Mesopusillimonas faecipullorum]MCB5364462.1 xanthine dehydrogenase family protein molybdopterin-binding subunit [Mesopusillimonas faecipullorum]